MPDLRPTRRSLTIVLVALVVAGLGSAAALWAGDASDPTADPSNLYDQTFARYWHDGRAEMASYDLTYPRYHQNRSGTAVIIVVTERHDPATRVKPERPTAGVGAIKLNLVEDFPTGIYDYNLMTSVFVPTESAGGFVAGQVSKISFSSQEWCGQVYQQALFDPKQVRLSLHSYVEGMADQRDTLKRPAGALSEDALMLWARQLAGPALQPGQAVQTEALRSLAICRMAHRVAAFMPVTLSRARQGQVRQVPAGRFDVNVFTASIAGLRKWTFYVEAAFPHRLIEWQRNDGYAGQMIEVRRLKYWQLHGNENRRELKDLGLHDRPARTP